MDIIIISIGALSKNPFWNEKAPVRTSHATTTVIRQDKQIILVDPSLPAQILEAKLFERTGVKAEAVTTVFLTNWRPVHRRGLELFSHAKWLISEAEMEAAEVTLDQAGQRAEASEEDVHKLLESERQLLKRVQVSPDQLGEGIDLFPLYGYTPGQAGLLVSQATSTTIIAGDAVPTHQHFSSGQVFQDSFDLTQAKESLLEMYEIADMIIPGHDNIFPNPRTSGLVMA